MKPPTVSRDQPDVNPEDLRLPDISGIDALIAIRTDYRRVRGDAYDFEGDVEIQSALEAGARGYLLKTTPAKDLVRGSPSNARGQETHPRGCSSPPG